MREKISILQGDEEIIEKLLSYLRQNFPRLKFRSKVPLRELFPEPKGRYLKSIWNHGHGDICVFRHNRLVCIIEPGGSAHFKDEKQKDRDRRKDKLCRENGVNCLRVSNSFVNYFSKLITKKLLKKYFYSLVR